MNTFYVMCMALFFIASGAMCALISRREKRARDKKIEYFQSVPDLPEKEKQG